MSKKFRFPTGPASSYIDRFNLAEAMLAQHKATMVACTYQYAELLQCSKEQVAVLEKELEAANAKMLHLWSVYTVG